MLLFGLTGVAVFAWYSRDLPDPNNITDRAVAQSTKIYARDGETLLYEVHGEEKRTIIKLEEVPLHARQATIVVEDRDFYKHSGFSFTGFLRAAWVNVTSAGHRRPGGSTITQQFVKNAILTSEKAFTRKIKEVILAYQIERRFTKEQILQLYFNEIPYGSNNYGIESAARSYFGKAARDLTLDESALLAALPQRPSYLSPYGSHMEELVGRQQFILSAMVDEGYLSAEEAEAAKAVDILKKIQPKREAIRAPHFVFYVAEYLSEKYGDQVLEQGGLKVTTTLDIGKQTIAEEEIQKQTEKDAERYKASNAALVALDPRNGEILAMVGSRDYFDAEHDGNVNVTIRPRQPGSSFKPVVYATAFKRGYTPDTLLFDLVTVFKTDTKDYTPHNYDLKEHGPVTMRQALAGSLNIPAVKTLYLAGIGNVLDTAQDLGYTTLQERSRFGLSLVLGGGEVKLLEHTAAFGVFAREGIRQPTTPILKVENATGKILEEAKAREGTRVLDEEIARQVTSVLSDNNARAFIFGSRNFLTIGGRPVAAKTGTTNDFRDAWTVGYTPSLVAGVWRGNNNNDEMTRGADGSVIAAPIWNGFMRRALEGAPAERFPGPKPITVDKPILQGKLEGNVKVRVDKVTKRKIPDGCAAYPPSFIEERSVQEAHTILFYVDKENPRGAPPKNPRGDPQFATWEAAVQQWVREHPEFAAAPVEEESCSLRAEENLPQPAFLEPTDGQTITAAAGEIRVSVSSPRTVTSAQFFIDDSAVETDTTAPFGTAVDWTRYASGAHRIRVEALDDVQNRQEASLTVTLQLSSASAKLLLPENNATITGSQLPVLLRAAVTHPLGITAVMFYVQGSGDPQIINTVSSPSGQTVETQWNGLPAGTYQLWVVGQAPGGQTVESARSAVTITP